MTTQPAKTMTPLKKSLLTDVLPRNGTYVSADDVEREAARTFGYEHVCQHPSEVGVLGPDDPLVIDFNSIQFGDTAQAVKVALAAARRGVPVGVHAYHLPPALAELLAEPLVVSGKTHREALRNLRRLIAARTTVTIDP